MRSKSGQSKRGGSPSFLFNSPFPTPKKRRVLEAKPMREGWVGNKTQVKNKGR